MVDGAIGVVLAGGFIIGSIGAAIGGHGLNLLAAGWIYLTNFLVWLLTLLLVPVLQFIADLLPEWILPGEAVATPRIPLDQPSITKVYALYFDMLTTAYDRGHAFQAAATPRERQTSLQQFLPGAPVAGITTAFNAACYGNIAAEMGLLSELRVGLEGGP